MSIPTLNISQGMSVFYSSVQTFASVFGAYKECDSEIQQVVDEMLEIVGSPDASADEQSHALDAIIEALFPGLTADIVEVNEVHLRRPEALEAKAAIDRQTATFSERLAAIMKQKGVTQEELANRTGIGQPAISMLLKRQSRPQQRTVERFAKALGVPVEELWQENGAQK